MDARIEQTPRIETRRLVLRAPRWSDRDRIAQLANDFDVARMTTSMPHPFHRQDAEAFLTRAQACDPASEAIFALDLEDRGLVGVLALHPLKPRGARIGSRFSGPEIGYWLGRPYWGRGLMSEAAAAALAWAKTVWRRRLVVAGHFADNPASGRVLEKAGFLYTGDVQPRHCQARGEAVATRIMVWLA
jgi:RimJ/RimL family protein N-acetyltransferase